MLAFTNAHLIDGTGAAPVAGATVLVKGKMIAAAARNVPVPDDATVIDLKGKTLLPGLMDSHAHFGDREDRPGLNNATESFNYAPVRDATLAWGVTTIRSCGDWLKDALETRDMIEHGLLRGPRMICCGKQFGKIDGHPATTVWRSDPDTMKNAGSYPETAEEARQCVRELAAAGVNYLKVTVAVSGLSVYPGTLEPLTDDVMEAIVDEGHKHGLWVMCHIDRASDAIRLINYGADEIDHLIAVGLAELPEEATYDRLFQLMVDKGTWFTPTIILARTCDRLMVEKGVPTTVDGYFIPHYRKAYEAGVHMGCGCDSGAPGIAWGRSLHAELREYVYGLGMPPLEAIKCATHNNATILGIDHKVGTIKEGLLADILIVDGDPAENIGDTKNICMVLKEGSIVVDKMLS
ncbi:MAG: amidohydrolase family protein [Actinomycetia bacterium]|nr:amidohydrolase family protein [Actinomycetes bacterium]